MGFFDLFKTGAKTGHSLAELVEHNAKIIQRDEGRSRKDAQYLAICLVIDDLKGRSNGQKGIQEIMTLLQGVFREHQNDVMTYLAWTSGEIVLKPDAERALRDRHAKGEGSSKSEAARRFAEEDRQPLLTQRFEDRRRLMMQQSSECCDEIAARWVHYNNVLKFKPDVKLSEIIEGFANPIQQFVQSSYPMLYGMGPQFFWTLIFTAIEKSGVPSVLVEKAAQEMGLKFKSGE